MYLPEGIMTDFKFEIGEEVIITNISDTSLHCGQNESLKNLIGEVRRITGRTYIDRDNLYKLENIIDLSLWWFNESELGRIYEEEYDGLHIKRIIDKVYGQKFF